MRRDLGGEQVGEGRHGYSRVTETLSWAVTSPWSRTGTENSPERLDGLVQRDAAPLDLDPVLGEERGDVRLADGAEQTAFVGRLPGLGEVQRLDGPRLLLRLCAVSFAAAASWLALIASRFFRFAAVAWSASLCGRR